MSHSVDNEIKQTLDSIADGFGDFKTRLEALEKNSGGELEQRVDALEVRAGRPGVPMGAPGAGVEVAEPKGTKTLSSETLLKGKDAIAARLGKGSNADNPVSMGDFVRGIAGLKVPDHVKSLTEGTDTEGGHAVPSALLPGILAALAPASSLISAGAGITSLEDQTAKSFKIASIADLPTAAWRLESGTVEESNPVFAGATIEPKSLAFYVKLSRELLQDAPGLNEALTTAIARAFAVAIDKAALFGSGADPEPLGLDDMTGIGEVKNGTNGAALSSYAKLVAAQTAILSNDAPVPTAAIMAPRTFGDYAGLVDANKQPLNRPPALSNWKFVQTSQIPINQTAGTSTDASTVFVGDFSQFRLFFREQMSLQVLDQLFAQTGEIGLLGHARVDVAALYPKAFCKVTGIRPATTS